MCLRCSSPGSFFTVRERVAKILPAPLTAESMRALPILLLFAVMFYWLWRVRRRTLPVPGLRDSVTAHEDVIL
jgi:hypothetical protein